MKASSARWAGVLTGASLLAYVRFFRPKVLNWGATEEEAKQPMRGDEILPTATLQTTRAVTVRARPQHIWPWLLQMGPRPRAGAYTYDWILEITDDGVGFEDSESFPGHMGLISMRERAAHIGAKLNVKSSLGKGTTVQVMKEKSSR